jgi:hypothetical protein
MAALIDPEHHRLMHVFTTSGLNQHESPATLRAVTEENLHAQVLWSTTRWVCRQALLSTRERIESDG